MEEFPVFDGRLKLARKQAWSAARNGERVWWVVEMAVVGLAGAVSLGAAVQDFASAADEPGEATVKARLVPVMFVHAYRPIPNSDCALIPDDQFLHGGEAYVAKLGYALDAMGEHCDPASLLNLAVQGHFGPVWAGLEEMYWREFVPARPEVEEREQRVRAADLAMARAQGAAHAPFSGDQGDGEGAEDVRASDSSE